MQTCPNCGKANTDYAKFCNECGFSLPIVSAPTSKPPSTTLDFSTLVTGIPSTVGRRCADIMFVLDCTGSMGGEISAIKDTIVAFADTIKSDGVRARVGLIEFRDRFYDEEANVLKFDGQVFTDNPTLFRTAVNSLVATGGGDAPESSLDAVLLATRQPFRTDASKVIVLVTDAPPHIPDIEAQSIEQVTTAIQSVGIDQFYIVMDVTDADSQVYLQFIPGRRGMAFPLGQGDDFLKRSQDFTKVLIALGKTISAGTT